METQAGNDGWTVAIPSYEGVFAVPVPAHRGANLFAERLIVDWMATALVGGLAGGRIMVEETCPNDPEALVQRLEHPAERSTAAGARELVGVQPQPPYVVRIGLSGESLGGPRHQVDPLRLVVVSRPIGQHVFGTRSDGPVNGVVGTPVIDQEDPLDALGERVCNGGFNDVGLHPGPDDRVEGKPFDRSRASRLSLGQNPRPSKLSPEGPGDDATGQSTDSRQSHLRKTSYGQRFVSPIASSISPGAVPPSPSARKTD